ncbi:MAG: TauD/TfdA family dioxygenase, partial [Rhodospirillaceae bacterium]|nr:TauD/TfdA family dioxygenase [Rhodospirillaceae bacterium]
MFAIAGGGAIANGTRQVSMPGMEAPDPAAWYADDMAKKSNEWIYPLSQRQIGELMDRVKKIESDGVDIKDITRENFPLPNIGPAMEDIYHELTEGRGFVLLRGLPVQEMTTWQAGAAFFGMGTYLGQAVSQNPMGHLLGHVKNLGKDYADPMVRGYQTAAQMNFHSDQCDYVGLMCMHPAKSGGASLIASSITVHNEMQKRRPDLAAALCNIFHFTKHGEVKEGEDPFYCMPIFGFRDGYLSIRAGGAHVRKAQTLPGVPKFTETDIEALDMFQELAKELYMPMEFEVGD